ncbi:thiamine pyrophosphate-dependent enzyme, partial [Nocardia abscessus]|uniref:thiamine pyrophosphate-dependent enzyme n=1 Tax=Nocardia abscessus TaxID=120957 RepID=UPI002455E5B9
SQGDLAEALGFAASWSAPVVLFCQNNHWAISEPVRVQSATPIARRARATARKPPPFGLTRPPPPPGPQAAGAPGRVCHKASR